MGAFEREVEVCSNIVYFLAGLGARPYKCYKVDILKKMIRREKRRDG